MIPPQVSSTQLETAFGRFEFHCFAFGDREEDNVLCLRSEPVSENPICRIQSACYTAEIFRSLDCDCHAQLEQSLRLIQQAGGLLVYMLCDGRGAGLYTKVRALELTRVEGVDTAAAYEALGIEPDPRDYSNAAEVLTYFGIAHVRLLTNNPRKIEGLVARGIETVREPLEIPATEDSRPYLLAKRRKLGHMLSQFEEDSD